MRRSRVALVSNGIWLAAGLAAAAAWLDFGATGLGIALTGAAVLAGFSLSLGFGIWSEREFQRQLGELGQAVGAVAGRDGRPSVSVEAIIANLAGRLERASQFKAAFSGLRQPALLINASGEILGASQGLLTLEPQAAEGQTLDALFGQGYLAESGGVAEEGLVVAGGQRLEARRRMVGAGRSVIELTPAGYHIADDDFDAFATALSGGQTSFCFDAAATRANPALRLLGESLGALDGGVRGLGLLAAGEALPLELQNLNSGFGPQVSALGNLIGALREQRDEEAGARAQLESKVQAILVAIDNYRASVVSVAELADGARGSLSTAGAAALAGRERVRAVQGLERDAVALVSDAVQRAARGQLAAAGVDTASKEIDKLVAAIEEVSFRTNLLALNAAVEAARAGEKGAGFAVVADEVRTLAQTSQRTARDIRSLVGHSREQSGTSADEAQNLKKILADLGQHLESLSNETGMIAGALDESGSAIEQLDGQVTAMGEAAAKALTLPARRVSQASR